MHDEEDGAVRYIKLEPFGVIDKIVGEPMRDE
jgi:hypothetical protein